MSRFIESICFENGRYGLLDLHQQRVDRTFRKYFPGDEVMQLERVLPQLDLEEKYKVRVLYDGSVVEVEFARYFTPKIKSLKLVGQDTVSYAFKSENRSRLHRLFEQRDTADDILIIKKGYVTDSYFANVAFWDGHEWFTPETYLLNGVRRQHLLETGAIKERKIRRPDIRTYRKVSLINAMLDLGELEVEIKAVLK